MTDERARENFGPAFDEKTPSRRQLLRAGVWAAPVIVLATAAPAAAGSITPTGPKFGDFFTLTKTQPVANYGHTLALNDAALDTTSRAIMSIVATMSMSPAPNPTASWVPTWVKPSASTQSGASSWTSAPFNLSYPSYGSRRLAFSAKPTSGSIVAAKYTMTLTLTFTENGKTISVSESFTTA